VYRPSKKNRPLTPDREGTGEDTESSGEGISFELGGECVERGTSSNVNSDLSISGRPNSRGQKKKRKKREKKGEKKQKIAQRSGSGERLTGRDDSRRKGKGRTEVCRHYALLRNRRRK